VTAVVLVDEAVAQLRDIVSWWRSNRAAARDLVLDEFERCVILLESTPDVGARFSRSSIPGVRKVLMRRTKHSVYYLHDAAHGVVYILAVWGSPQAGDPLLRDPRL
jgi:plasmid stabilization system protein ParE